MKTASYKNPLLQAAYVNMLAVAASGGTALFRPDGERRRGSSQACAFWDGFDGARSAHNVPGSLSGACYQAGKAFKQKGKKMNTRELRKRAEAVPTGARFNIGDMGCMMAYAAFQAEASPQAVIELLDTIDRLTEELSHAELAATAEAQESDRRKAALVAVTAERDALRVYLSAGAQPRVPMTETARGFAVMEHLGPAALTGGRMSVLEAFGLGLDAAEAHHGIENGKK